MNTSNHIETEAQRWERLYAELVAFKEQHGHTRAHRRNHSNTMEQWCKQQRLLRREGRLAPEREERLQALGFAWVLPNLSIFRPMEGDADHWEKRYAELVVFELQHGHTRAHRRNHSPALEIWCKVQRARQLDGRMTPTQRGRLEVLGFAWELQPQTNFLTPAQSDAYWAKRLAELEAFRERYGQVRVSKRDAAWPGLGGWLEKQRSVWRAGTLPPERVARLEALGVESQIMTDRVPGTEAAARWEKRCAELMRFREQYGHCDVPSILVGNQVLADWVHSQRSNHRLGRMTRQHRERLEAVGFTWRSEMTLLKAAWEKRFAELTTFKAATGHVGVTRRNESTHGLCYWLADQRQLMRDARMEPERAARLDALAPAWRGRDSLPEDAPKDALSQWDYFFARLEAFHATHGHPNVPSPWPEDRALAAWVREQRTGREYGRLHFDQHLRLEKLGFAW